MKPNSKIAALIVSFLIGAGVTYYNVEDQLPVSPLTEYKFRSLDKPLYVTFHHTAAENLDLKNIATYHVEQKGWPGIAYHFAIDPQGQVFQLQKLEEITYHSAGHNTGSIGVVFLGNFQNKHLSKEAVDSAECLLMGLDEALTIKGVRGHRDVRATLCPGDYAYADLQYLFY